MRLACCLFCFVFLSCRTGVTGLFCHSSLSILQMELICMLLTLHFIERAKKHLEGSAHNGEQIFCCIWMVTKLAWRMGEMGTLDLISWKCLNYTSVFFVWNDASAVYVRHGCKVVVERRISLHALSCVALEKFSGIHVFHHQNASLVYWKALYSLRYCSLLYRLGLWNVWKGLFQR